MADFNANLNVLANTAINAGAAGQAPAQQAPVAPQQPPANPAGGQVAQPADIQQLQASIADLQQTMLVALANQGKVADAKARQRLQKAALIPLDATMTTTAKEGKYISFPTMLAKIAPNTAATGQSSGHLQVDFDNSTVKTTRKQVPLTSAAHLFHCLATYLYHYADDDLQRHKDALAYIAMLASKLERHTLSAIIDLDDAHRQQMASDPDDTLLIHVATTASTKLDSATTRPQQPCPSCMSTNHSASDCPFATAFAAGRPSKRARSDRLEPFRDNTCGDFNSARGCTRTSCKYAHLCRKCRKPDCKKGFAKCGATN